MNAAPTTEPGNKNLGAARAARLAAARKNPAAPGEVKPFLGIKRGTAKFPKKELIKFCRGMASMLKAQINTSDALRYYSHGHPNADVRKTLSQVRAMIEAGAPTYAAFAKTKKFDDKFISLVRAGTDSGQIHQAFASIAHRLKKEAEFKAKVRKATVMPMIVITILIGLFIAAQLKIVPEVEGILNDVNQAPDQFSAIMFTISHITQKTWPLVILGMIGFFASIVFSEKVRTTLLNLAMSKWRLLRQLVMGMRQMLFLGSLNMLHSNGITLARSIEISAMSLKGTPMYKELLEAGKRYQISGLPFSEAVRKFTSCDPQVGHMISIGERSSSLDDQLRLLTEMYEEDVDQCVNDFTQVINLLSLILACILISAVFIGAFLPIFLMGPKMMNGQGI